MYCTSTAFGSSLKVCCREYSFDLGAALPTLGRWPREDASLTWFGPLDRRASSCFVEFLSCFLRHLYCVVRCGSNESMYVYLDVYVGFGTTRITTCGVARLPSVLVQEFLEGS